jgi:hypothetical protein
MTLKMPPVILNTLLPDLWQRNQPQVCCDLTYLYHPFYDGQKILFSLLTY